MITTILHEHRHEDAFHISRESNHHWLHPKWKKNTWSKTTKVHVYAQFILAFLSQSDTEKLLEHAVKGTGTCSS